MHFPPARLFPSSWLNLQHVKRQSDNEIVIGRQSNNLIVRSNQGKPNTYALSIPFHPTHPKQNLISHLPPLCSSSSLPYNSAAIPQHPRTTGPIIFYPSTPPSTHFYPLEPIRNEYYTPPLASSPAAQQSARPRRFFISIWLRLGN
ncbi:hypothetical protein DAPPUDRAFT_262106 [Daphnia pulex]|uniref:Uncharacterized protein n=1 Tax=Daphnia pulex TaxID=6669 RepID=E9HMD1_DAPPU|nr:hypothetical protein DAPPUDRAFT_262106 [Daphnia pulex]|eukprot:EFX67128.1 hypothetical protein DAPPUDRAFT_262106 [Daphnia pulex]